MPQVARQLAINITSSNVWTQLQRLDDASNYVVPGSIPSANRGDLKWMRILNLGANAATVEFALSPDNTPTDAQRMLPPITLQPGASLLDSLMHTLPPTYGVWARAVGTSPNVTFTGNLLEITA